MFDLQQYLQEAVGLAKKAGKTIMVYYDQPESLNIKRKDDHSPLTAADLAANEVIMNGLEALNSDIFVLSEEGEHPEYPNRKDWGYYWLIDPIDGTRGFIDHLPEFTVNIALIHKNKPVLGVVYAPVQKTCYYALHGHGCFRQFENHPPIAIQARSLQWEQLVLVAGHYRVSDTFLDIFRPEAPNAQLKKLNSSLKFCWIAEGLADVYPRLGRTSEWDSGAAQCVLEEAGGTVINLQGRVLTYNDKDVLFNPEFVAVGDASKVSQIIEILKRREQ